VRFRVGNALLRESSKHCNFKGDDCWYVKTHPRIDSINAVDGYTTGGQTLNITGWGLKPSTNQTSDVTVTVDGVGCKVTNYSLSHVTCVTSPATKVSYEGPQPGSPGLRQQIIDPTDENQQPYWNMRTDGVHPVVKTKLMTVFEDDYGNYTNAATSTKGWFKAPETGRYRFYIACDDTCKLWLDAINKFTPAATTFNLVELGVRNVASGWRNYHRIETMPDAGGNKWISDWQSLEKDQYY